MGTLKRFLPRIYNFLENLSKKGRWTQRQQESKQSNPVNVPQKESEKDNKVKKTTLSIPWNVEWKSFEFWDVEAQTGATQLQSTREMKVQITYMEDTTAQRIIIIGVTFPNGKTAVPDPEHTISEECSNKWYQCMQKSADLAMPYTSSKWCDTTKTFENIYDITPKKLEDDDYARIHFLMPT